MEIRERARQDLRELIALSYRDALLQGAATPKRWTNHARIVAMGLRECKVHFTAGGRKAKEAVISICGVVTRDERLRFPTGIQSLRLQFDDIHGLGLGLGPSIDGAVAFGHEHVRQIYQFVECLPSDLETLIVHCKAGVSRSRAVAAALQRLCGEDDLGEFIEGVPNGDVYTKLLGLPPHPAPLQAFHQAQRAATRACLRSRL